MRKHVPRLDSFDRPNRVLGDERFAVARRARERRQIVARSDIAERDADVAQKAAALDPLDRRAAKHFSELLVIEREEIAQPHLRDRRPRRERALARNLREAIPRAGVEAIVATVNAIADQRPELERDAAFQLDR